MCFDSTNHFSTGFHNPDISMNCEAFPNIWPWVNIILKREGVGFINMNKIFTRAKAKYIFRRV